MRASDPVCPWCGGALTIDPEALVVSRVLGTFTVPGVREFHQQARLAAVAFCSQCEFCLEIGKEAGDATRVRRIEA